MHLIMADSSVTLWACVLPLTPSLHTFSAEKQYPSSAASLSSKNSASANNSVTPSAVENLSVHLNVHMLNALLT